MKTIRIDGEGDGSWIMSRTGGVFVDTHDHSFMSLRDGARLGGFALTGFMGAAMTVHMAGDDTRWCSRDLMWIIFDYGFNQLGLRKLLAPVASTNHVALALDLRAGWQIEAVLKEVYPDGDMVVLSMTKDRCRWLNHKPRTIRSNQPKWETA